MFVGNALTFIPCDELESAYKNFLVEPKYLRIFVAGDSFIGKHGLEARRPLAVLKVLWYGCLCLCCLCGFL